MKLYAKIKQTGECVTIVDFLSCQLEGVPIAIYVSRSGQLSHDFLYNFKEVEF